MGSVPPPQTRAPPHTRLNKVRKKRQGTCGQLSASPESAPGSFSRHLGPDTQMQEAAFLFRQREPPKKLGRMRPGLFREVGRSITGGV